MKIASEAIRTLVVKTSLSETASRQHLSEIFGYTTASYQQLAPRPFGHRKPMLTDAALEQFSELLKKNVDLTWVEIQEHFGMRPRARG